MQLTNLEEYLSGVNKTWKSDERDRELQHCETALLEEIGEIAGWYKKRLFYGLEEVKFKTGVKGEFGDLLYYLAKYSELLNNNDYLNVSLNDNSVPFNPLKELVNMNKNLTYILELGEGYSMTLIAIGNIASSLTKLINLEGFTVEDIAQSNLAKLKARHGDLFNPIQADPNQRNLELEDRVL